MNKFIFEYPLDWIQKKDPQNLEFISNINSSLMELEQIVSIVPTGYPSYGIPRLDSNIPHLAFHSYNNPHYIWSYKEAPIKGLFSIDPRGYGGWSDIASNLDRYQEEINKIENYDEIISPYKEQLKNGISKYLQPQKSIRIQPNYILFALQVRTDSVADHAYIDVLDVLNEVDRLSKKYQKRVVIKPHPKCNSELLTAHIFRLSYNNPMISISYDDIIQLIQHSDRVVACNSGVSLEALILDKDVYCFGMSEWFHITNQIKEIKDIENIFDRNYNNKIDAIYQKKYIAFLLSEYWVRYEDKKKIKAKLKQLINLSSPSKNSTLNLEEQCTTKILDIQTTYMKKIKKLELIEKDFKNQQKIMQYFRKKPLYIIIYFIKFNLLKLKSKK